MASQAGGGVAGEGPVGTGAEDQPSEVERLRREVEALRAQQAEGTAEDPPVETKRGGRWRALLVGFLLLLVAVLAPVTVLARWADWVVSDTDTYVDVVSPLASDPAVQEAIAARVTEVIFTYVDVPAVTDEVVGALDRRGLPPRVSDGLRALAVPLSNGIENFVDNEVLKFVESDTFEDAWVAINRQAHAQIVVALTGKADGAVQIEDGTVTLDLGEVVAAVKKRLVDQGFTVASRIPTVNAEYVIMQSDELAKAQTGFRLLQTSATVLPIITLLLVALAVAVSTNRRRGLIAGALAVAGGMLVLGLLLITVRPLYLDALPPRELAQAAAASFFDALVGYIRTNVRGILLISLIVAFAAWVAGSGSAAVGVRRGTSSAIKRIRDGRERGFGTGAFGEFLWSSRLVLRIGIPVVAVAVLLFQSPVTGGDVIVTTLVALVVWVLAELLAAPPDGPEDTAAESTPVVDARP